MKKLLLTTLSLFTVSAHAWEPSFYAGANYGTQQFKHSGTASNFTVKSVEGLAGIVLTEYIALEARVGTGLGEDTEQRTWIVEIPAPEPEEGEDAEEPTQSIYNLSSTYRTNFYGSVYFRPYLSNDKATLYGLLGYTTLDFDYEETLTVDGTPTSSSVSDSEGGVSFGIGVSFVMSPNVDLTAEWKKTINSDDFDMRGGNIGFKYKF